MYLNGISIIDARIGETFWKAFKNGDSDTIDFIISELEAPFFEGCARNMVGIALIKLFYRLQVLCIGVIVCLFST